MLNHVDLFSGIGGFALGFEATRRIKTCAFVEIDPFCQKVLKKHWPAVPLYDNIRTVYFARGSEIDILSGGFPCQNVSTAGIRWGPNESILGDRSGLWFEFYRLIVEAHPKWVVIENVEALRSKGLAIILQQLADLGYDAEWHTIRACDVGLPHVRKRLWIIAHHHSNRTQGLPKIPLSGLRRVPWRENGRAAEEFAWRWYNSPPELLRTRNGIPNFVDRVRAIGNSIVPQIAQIIGEAILEAEYGPPL